MGNIGVMCKKTPLGGSSAHFFDRTATRRSSIAWVILVKIPSVRNMNQAVTKAGKPRSRIRVQSMLSTHKLARKLISC